MAPAEVVGAQFAAGGAASPKPLPWRRLVLAMLAVVLVAGALYLRRSSDRGAIGGARSRPAGQPMVRSDTTIAMMRGFGEEPGTDQLDRLATATGAQLVLSAKAEMMGAQ